MTYLKKYKIVIGSLAAFGILAAETACFAGPPIPHPGFFPGLKPLFDLGVIQ